ncbi:hypothetical protein CU048_15495 [Beijerinckiaceae bacterium]|nr:hypothetical protein CU048_15495 [Beijerinckiaceae bacterium]
MADDETPEVTMVPVKRYDVNVTLDEILTPLVEISNRQVPTATGIQMTQLEPHLQKLSDLAKQLKEVVGQINEIHPALLTPQTQRRSTTE